MNAPDITRGYATLRIIAGVFERLDDWQVRFLHAEAPTPQDVAVIAKQMRRPGIALVCPPGLPEGDGAEVILAWDGDCLLVDDAVRIAGHNRTGLDRLLCCCARPLMALDRLEQVPGWQRPQQVVYRLPKAQCDGRAERFLCWSTFTT